jgi:hypothetical protein
MLVPIVATALLTFLSDSSFPYSTVFRSGVFAAGIAYFLLGMGTAMIFLITPFLNRVGILFALEFIYILLLGGAILLISISTKSSGDKEAQQLRRVQQVVTLESRVRALRQQVENGSLEAIGLDKVLDEVRYFDKNSVSQFDSAISEKILDLESILLTRDESLLPEFSKPQSLLNMQTDNQTEAPAPPPPPVTESPQKLIADLQKLVLARHQETTRTKRGGF